MGNVISVPILLIGFNRPEVIFQSLDYIRKVKPTKLYIAIDGARKDKQGETKLVDEVKQIVKQIDWTCEAHYKFNDENKGAEISISSAISWVLEKEEFVIVIEDDIIAPLSFFKFAQEMLYKYKDEESVYMISSNQNTPIALPNDEDYLFGIYGHIWGWATWRRAWKNFDLDINDFDEFLKSGIINKLTYSNQEKKLWLSLIKQMKRKGRGNNTWDVCWSYIRFKDKGLSIIPKVNLSSNIGVDGLHTKGKTVAHYRPYDENYIAVKHPKKILQNIEYDNYHFKNHINKRPKLIDRAINKVIRMFK